MNRRTPSRHRLETAEYLAWRRRHGQRPQRRPHLAGLRRFAMRAPVVCDDCGFACERARLAEFQLVSLPGILGLASGDCEQEETVVACPNCGAAESFQDAIRCAECGEYPCCCRKEPT